MNINVNVKRIINKANSQFPGVGPVVKGVLDDFPKYQRNVFIMMRFKATPQFEAITAAIRSSLKEYGLWGLRADDKAYADDLWLNICGYMWACNYGIAVFEDIEERDFNPNIALECGFMMALGKRVLILKEGRMTKMPTDITGKLWKPFSVFEIEISIKRTIDQWAKDIGLTALHVKTNPYRPVGTAPLFKQALIQEIKSYMLEPESDQAKLEMIMHEIERLDVEHDPENALSMLLGIYRDEMRRQLGDKRTRLRAMAAGF